MNESKIIYVTAARLSVILPAVNAALRGLKEIRGLQGHRGSKEIPVVLALRATEATKGLWDHRDFRGCPAQEAPEEIPGR